jgi:hypothetical protein
MMWGMDMASYRVASPFSRLDEIELSLCLFFNRACHRRTIERLFAVVSRLGDGHFWYGLMLFLALLDYPDGLHAVLHLGAVALRLLGYGDVIESLDAAVAASWLTPVLRLHQSFTDWSCA